jgi:hypothetical protein
MQTILRLLAFLRRSTDALEDILAGFETTLTRLDRFVASRLEDNANDAEEIEVRQADIRVRTAQVTRALKVRDNIEALVRG